jgi:hypothetical protein
MRSGCPVVADGRLAGIVSRHDLLRESRAEAEISGSRFTGWRYIEALIAAPRKIEHLMVRVAE